MPCCLSLLTGVVSLAMSLDQAWRSTWVRKCVFPISAALYRKQCIPFPGEVDFICGGPPCQVPALLAALSVRCACLHCLPSMNACMACYQLTLVCEDL